MKKRRNKLIWQEGKNWKFYTKCFLKSKFNLHMHLFYRTNNASFVNNKYRCYIVIHFHLSMLIVHTRWLCLLGRLENWMLLKIAPWQSLTFSTLPDLATTFRKKTGVTVGTSSHLRQNMRRSNSIQLKSIDPKEAPLRIW